MGGGTVADWLEPPMRAALVALPEWKQAAVVAYGEARSEPVQGIVAVCHTFTNRVDAHSWFGKSITEVVLKPWQYSCLHPKGGPRNYEKVLALAEALVKGDDSIKHWKQVAWITRGVLVDMLDDNTKGSTHYHAATMNPRPAWAQSVTPTIQIGGHVFYAGVK